jgi:hypothetical protein
VTGLFCVRFPNRSTWACAALGLALVASGCGDDSASSSDAPADDPETVTAVTKKIGVAAGRIANSTPDRNLPGPYTFKTVCLTPDQARSFGTPRESVQCHIEAFTTPGKGRKAGAYVWSEDWRVPVQDGQLGEPEIVGEYRIRNFLRKDNRLNCSGGKTPQERCTGVYKTPPGETGIPGAAPPVP